MSGETDRLLKLAKSIHPRPSARELDQILATGEQVSTALLALALEKMGVPARSYLGSAERLMNEGCLGQIPEILDGDAPHQQRGCDAQAWGVTEALRVWKMLK